jgi:hypothetical protein
MDLGCGRSSPQLNVSLFAAAEGSRLNKWTITAAGTQQLRLANYPVGDVAIKIEVEATVAKVGEVAMVAKVARCNAVKVSKVHLPILRMALSALDGRPLKDFRNAKQDFVLTRFVHFLKLQFCL